MAKPVLSAKHFHDEEAAYAYVEAPHSLGLVIQLDDIRLSRVTRGELVYYKAQAARKYEEAFREAGLGNVHDPPEHVAALVNTTDVRWALLAALDDWAVCAADTAQRGWLLEVARQTDSSSGGWRERVLDPAGWEDRAALAELARTAPVASESVPLLLALGERLSAARGDAAPFLRRVQDEHPADFWPNLILAARDRARLAALDYDPQFIAADAGTTEYLFSATRRFAAFPSPGATYSIWSRWTMTSLTTNVSPSFRINVAKEWNWCVEIGGGR